MSKKTIALLNAPGSVSSAPQGAKNAGVQRGSASQPEGLKAPWIEREPDWSQFDSMIDDLARRKTDGNLYALGKLVYPKNGRRLHQYRTPKKNGRRMAPSTETLVALALVAGDDVRVWLEVGGKIPSTHGEELSPTGRQLALFFTRQGLAVADGEYLMRIAQSFRAHADARTSDDMVIEDEARDAHAATGEGS